MIRERVGWGLKSLFLTAQSLSPSHSLSYPWLLVPLLISALPRPLSLATACSPSSSPSVRSSMGGTLVTCRCLTKSVQRGGENGCHSPPLTWTGNPMRNWWLCHSKHHIGVQTGSSMHITIKAS